MFGRKVNKGLDITRESWQALMMDKELVVFPIMSAIAGAAVVATIFLAGFLIPEFGQQALSMANKEAPHTPLERAVGLVCLFAVYYVEYFVVVYFNTALVGCAMMRFSGGNPTVSDGFRIASVRLPQIAAWAFVAALVGTLLGALEERMGWLGKLVLRLIGLAWAVATYFVVPVLAAEGTGPITAIRRSTTLLRQTWGEGLVGNFAIHLVSWAVGLVGVLLVAAGVALAAMLESWAIFAVTIFLLVVGVIVMAILTSAMRQIFLAALYRYATTGQVATGFSQSTMTQALATGKRLET